MTSAMRVVLVQPAHVDDPLLSYYAVADLDVDGQCECFGHAATCSGQVRVCNFLFYFLKPGKHMSLFHV